MGVIGEKSFLKMSKQRREKIKHNISNSETHANRNQGVN